MIKTKEEIKEKLLVALKEELGKPQAKKKIKYTGQYSSNPTLNEALQKKSNQLLLEAL